MDKRQISERPCDYQHYKGISTGEWEPSIPRQFVIWMKGRKKRMLSTVYFDYSLLATPWSPTLPSHITCGAPALQAPSLGQPTRAATPSVTSGQSTHCGSLPSIWRGMLSRRDRNRAIKKPVSTFMKCGSLDPEMSWASLFTQKSNHCAYRSTRDQQPLEGAPRGQMKTRSLDLERQSPGWGQHGSLIYKGCS